MALEYPAPIDVLPHRDPILWVDSVNMIEIGTVSAVWTPGPEHYTDTVFLDHVKIIESLAQAGAYSMFLAQQSEVEGKRAVAERNDEDFEKPEALYPLFVGIPSAKYAGEVTDGQTLDLNVGMDSSKGSSFTGIGIATVEGQEICRASISGLIAPERLFGKMVDRREVVDGTVKPIEHKTKYRPVEKVLRGVGGITLDGIDDADAKGAGGFWLPGDEYFDGHVFAGRRILPGVRTLGMARNLAQYHIATEAKPGLIPLFAEARDVMFKSPVRPTERIDMDVELAEEPTKGNDYTYAAMGRVGETEVFTASLDFRKSG